MTAVTSSAPIAPHRWHLARRSILDAVAEFVGSAETTVTYIRHKPDENHLVGFAVQQPSGPQALGHARRWADSDDATRAFDKARSFRAASTDLGFSVERLDPHTIIWAFPNDPRLRSLRWISDPRKLKRTFAHLSGGDRIRSTSTANVLSYKPQRRVVALVDLVHASARTRSLVVRYTATCSGTATLDAARRLLEAGAPTARPVGTVLDGFGAVTDFLPGEPLVRALEEAPAATARAVGGLASRLAATQPDAPAFDWRTVAQRRVNELTWLCHAHPRLHRAAASVAADLARGPSGTRDASPPCTLHGDLRIDNVLATDVGLAVIDLERVGCGPPAFDLGTLLASAEAAEAEQQSSPRFDRFVDSMTGIAEDAVGRAQLGWHRAAALVGVAVRHERTHLAPDADYLATILDRTMHHLRMSQR